MKSEKPVKREKEKRQDAGIMGCDIGLSKDKTVRLLIITEGIKIGNYQNNPLVFWDHNLNLPAKESQNNGDKGLF